MSIARNLTPQILSLLACPVCHSSLEAAPDELLCTGCSRRYPVQDGIPILLPSAGTLPHEGRRV